MQCVIKNSLFQGSTTTAIENNGIVVSGSNTQLYLLSNLFRLFETAIHITGGANTRIVSNAFETTTTGIFCNGGTLTELIGSTFSINNVDSKNVAASGVNTHVEMNGCDFNGTDTLGAPQGIAVEAIAGASMHIVSCGIEDVIVAIHCGDSGDTSDTGIETNGVSIENCTTDILQEGSSTMRFVGGIFNTEKLSIANSVNVSFAAFDSAVDADLAIGNNTDTSHILYQVLNGQPNLPFLTYESDYYGNKGSIYINPNANNTVLGVQAQSNNANVYAVTGDRTKEASVNLISDSGNIGNPDNVRGWTLSKTGTDAELAFTYTNRDTSGQAERGSNTVMQLDGFNNQVEFPEATNAPLPTNTVARLVWAGDTNLYRSAVNTLRTDGNLVVNGLTPSRVLVSDSNNQLASSTATESDLNNLAGVTGPIQAQLDARVLKAGDTMTGALQVPAGTTSAPTIRFTGSTTTGLSANSDALSLSTNAAERMRISSTGTVSINQFNTAGVVHNDASGNLSSSLIVNADVSPAAAIADTKLATITTAGKVANSATTATSANTANAIVARDASGNFSAGTITASLTGASSLNVLKSGDTMTGALTLPAGTVTTPSLNFSGSPGTGLSANASELSLSSNGAERIRIANDGTIAVNQFTTAGVVHNDSSGRLSSSLIVDADVSPTAAIVDTKLATISTAGKVANSATTATSANTANAIVARDASGNFNAGTITLSGALQVPAGTAAAPTIRFTGSTTTGLSAPTANTLSLDANGAERMSISATAITATPKFIFQNPISYQAIQTVVPTSNGSVIAATTTGVLLLRHAVNVTNFTIFFPANPINGQLFSITLGTTNTITLINNGNGASVVNEISSLNPSAFSSTSSGASVTYLYFSTTNTWYRYNRG
jgi:hypothetical protein